MGNASLQQIEPARPLGAVQFVRREDIEGLRAVAVTAVVLFHYFPPNFQGGFVGVDVFFVISGYVVTLSIVRRIASSRFTFATFYARRIRRLFPALSVVSLACFLASWAFHFQNEFSELGLELLLSSIFVVNIKFALGPGYFDTSAPPSVILHFWSLSVEEQFYLLWPLFLVLIYKIQIRIRISLIAVVLIASFLFQLILAKASPHIAFYTFPARAWEFAVGGGIAMFSLYFPSRSIWTGLVSITGLVLIFGSVLLIGNDVVFSPWKALWPVLGAALVIAAPMSPVNSLFLAKTAMTWIGQRSYPIYLWHWPPIVFYKTIFDSDPSLPVAVAMLLCIVAISHLTYRFVERPFRATSASSVVPLMSRIAVPFLVTSSLALALFGSLAWHSYLYERLWPARHILAAKDDWMSTIAIQFSAALQLIPCCYSGTATWNSTSQGSRNYLTRTFLIYCRLKSSFRVAARQFRS